MQETGDSGRRFFVLCRLAYDGMTAHVTIMSRHDQTTHSLRKNLGCPCRPSSEDDGTCLLYIDRHLIHEVTSPRRRSKACALRVASLAPAPKPRSPTEDHNVPTSNRLVRHSRTRKASMQVETLERQLQSKPASTLLEPERHPPGHCPHHRARARLHPARHDHRLRRLPYRDAWRIRRAGLRHRHVGSRTCAGDADADPGAGENHAHHGQRRAA